MLISSSSLLWDSVVLAGGQSSRMGQDKALLQWHGVPLYQHMANILQQAGARRVMVNRFDDPRFDDNKDWIRDRIPGHGPLSGIHTALYETDADALMIVPVDMPLLQPEHIDRLLSYYDNQRPVEFGGYSLPLLLPVNDNVRIAVEEAITSENRQNYALWRLIERLEGCRIDPPADHEQAFANANTPAEWRACQLQACQLMVE